MNMRGTMLLMVTLLVSIPQSSSSQIQLSGTNEKYGLRYITEYGTEDSLTFNSLKRLLSHFRDPEQDEFVSARQHHLNCLKPKTFSIRTRLNHISKYSESKNGFPVDVSSTEPSRRFGFSKSRVQSDGRIYILEKELFLGYFLQTDQWHNQLSFETEPIRLEPPLTWRYLPNNPKLSTKGRLDMKRTQTNPFIIRTPDVYSARELRDRIPQHNIIVRMDCLLVGAETLTAEERVPTRLNVCYLKLEWVEVSVEVLKFVVEWRGPEGKIRDRFTIVPE